MLITITSKRQATFPKSLLDLLGADKGDKLIAKVNNGIVTLEPVKGDVLDLYGFLENKSKMTSLEDVIIQARLARAKRIAEGG